MGVDRLERVNSLVRREIAGAMPIVMADSGIDIAAVTVTGVSVSVNLRNATVSVSVFGHEKERGSFLSKLRARRNEFQKLINRNIRLKYTPVLHFELDSSIEKGDHVLDVLSKMEMDGTLPPDSGEEIGE